MKGKCKYCNKVLADITNIRCDNCDEAWHEGMEAGKDEVKDDIRRALQFLKSLMA